MRRDGTLTLEHGESRWGVVIACEWPLRLSLWPWLWKRHRLRRVELVLASRGDWSALLRGQLNALSRGFWKRARAAVSCGPHVVLTLGRAAGPASSSRTPTLLHHVEALVERMKPGGAATEVFEAWVQEGGDAERAVVEVRPTRRRRVRLSPIVWPWSPPLLDTEWSRHGIRNGRDDTHVARADGIR